MTTDTTTTAAPPAPTARECADAAAGALREAQKLATAGTYLAQRGIKTQPEVLVAVARTWLDLGVAVAQHIAMHPPRVDGDSR